MKKVIEILVVVMVVGFCSNAFAVLDANTNEGTTAGESIRLTDGLTDPATVVLNFSPSVNILYQASTDDAAGNKQWYSVSTYHADGSNFYASSSDSTGIYKQERDANNVFSDVTIPTSQTMTVGEGDAAEEVSAEQYWLNNSWEK
jgi:hypothetical protein